MHLKQEVVQNKVNKIGLKAIYYAFYASCYLYVFCS